MKDFRSALGGLLFVGLLAFPGRSAAAVVFTTDTQINITNNLYEGQDLVVSNGVLTVDGTHVFNSLRVSAGATLTHTATAQGTLPITATLTNEAHQLISTNPVMLPTTTINPDSLVVTDTNSLVTYTNAVDYELTHIVGIGYNLARTTNSAIADGDIVFVTYDFLATTSVGLNLTLTNDFELEPGASLNLVGRGYGGNFGAGNGGEVGSPQSGAGAGHGGFGGSSSTNAAGGNCYGAFNQPQLPGSGGGLGTSDAGGSGGGIFRMAIGGNAIINGMISANGADATNSRSGGGSGGSIWLTAQTLSGAGMITANGGNGEPIHGGGGGGGRIALYFSTNEFSGPVTAYGGAGWQRGGAGTVYQVNTQLNHSTVEVNNGGNAGTNSLVGTIGGSDLIIGGGARVDFSGSQTIGHLVIRSNSWLQVPVAAIATLIIYSNAVIEAGGEIRGQGRGSASASGGGAGQSATFTNVVFGTGGGYGGAGSPAAPGGTGGLAHGSSINPISYGGGGGNNNGSGTGGAGGGYIRLNITGSLLLDGKIVANGMPGTATRAGGGAGGTVFITTGTFAGGGQISADGGSGNNGGGNGGGGRIAIFFTTNSFSGPITAFGGTNASASPGGAGSLLLKSNLAAGELRYVNSRPTPVITSHDLNSGYGVVVAGGATVRFATASVTVESLLMQDESTLLVPGSLTLQVNGSANIAAAAKITGDGAGNAINSGSGAGTFNFSANTGNGAGHGGFGGRGSNNPTGGGIVFDSVSNPNQVGGGGGATQGQGGNYTAGSGGGALRLTVTGELRLDGLISVNGGSAVLYNNGGGAGGSVFVSAGKLSGAGRIAAEGGAAHAFGGGGGGGRIAVLWTTNNFVGTYSAKGGPGFSPGGAGTIYLRSIVGGLPSLILDNGGQAGTTTVLEINSLLDLYIGNGAIVTNSQFVSLTVSNLYLGTNAALRSAATTFTVTAADAVTLSPGSGIYVEGVSTSGSGNGGGIPSYTGAGHGGYGGRGGGASSFFGGNVYGLPANPSQPGSRGGGNTGSGNNGGGSLRMTVGGPLQLNGRLSVNATSQATNTAGGGSGGSIWLTLNQFSGTGALTANGGNGSPSTGDGGANGSPGGGGGGGGGRIAVYYFTNTFSGSLQARGGSGFGNGGAGTVYLLDRRRNNPDLILDNGSLIGTNTLIETSPIYNRVLITGGSRAGLSPGGGTLSTTWFQLETNSSILGNFSLSFGSNAVIAAGASILADVSSASTSGVGFGANHFNGAGGGGHGGNGGRGAAASGGNAYDFLHAPTMAGGNGGYSTFGGGGAGGGVIILGGHLLWSRLTLDGLVSANGGSVFTNGSGGGAGGTVSIGVNQFSGVGQINANGGNGISTGGGGGGGRIAVSVATNLFGGTYAAKGGTGWMAGGAGTIYKKTNSPFSNFASVLLDNGGLRGTNTPFVPAGGAGTLDITVQNGATPLNLNLFQIRDLLVRSNGWIAQTNSFTVSQDLTIEPGGGFDLDGFAISGTGAGVTSFNTKGGGGHGGHGGNNPSEFNGRAYDSIIAPNQSGSPGGNGSGSSSAPLGGAGGGAVKVNVGRTLTLDGIMRSNGKDGDFDSGGGSGGSIWIETKTFAGGGVITANGGAGNNAAGGGGGGRIAVYSATNLFTGNIIAHGGAGSIAGGAGTIYLKRSNSPIAELIIANQNLPFVASTPLTTAHQIPTNVNLTLSDWATVEALTSLPLINALVLSNQSALRSPTNGVALLLNVTSNITVTADSIITAHRRGAPRNQGIAPGGSVNYTGGGGGHGGVGGNSLSGGLGGSTYGWATQPILPGSGGGEFSFMASSSSSGGGVIRIIAGGQLRVDGTVNADGELGWADDSGGGAGGSIWITAPALVGVGNITALGGDGDFFAGGGGGGGRIAIYAPGNSFTGWMNVAGGDGAYGGGIGTIFVSTNLFPIESLSGRVTNLLGQPIAGVLIQATGGLTNTTTDGNGQYSLVVTGGWTGTLTAVLTTNVFVPSIRSYSNFGPSLTEENFLMLESAAQLIPTFTWQQLGTNLQVVWPNIPGVMYQLQTSTNLVDWQLTSWGYSSSNGTNTSSGLPIQSFPQQFFRMRATY